MVGLKEKPQARQGGARGGVSGKRQVASKGVKTLYEAASAVLDREGVAIANSLALSSKKGSMPCAKLLVELAMRQAEGEAFGKKQDWPRAVEKLALEPEWRSDHPQEGAALDLETEG
jgi:hypothetical protein